MSFSRGVVLILSPFNEDCDFRKIYEAIENLEIDSIKEENSCNFFEISPKKVLEPFEVFEKQGKLCKIEESVGLIAKEAIIPYPPGIPLVCQGEIITQDAINIVKSYINNKKDVIGLYKDSFKVIDTE